LLNTLATDLQIEVDEEKKKTAADLLRSKGVELVQALNAEEEAKATYEKLRTSAEQSVDKTIFLQNDYEERVKDVSATVNTLVAEISTANDPGTLDRLKAELADAQSTQRRLSLELRDGDRPESVEAQLDSFKSGMDLMKTGLLATNAGLQISGDRINTPTNEAQQLEMRQMAEELAALKVAALEEAKAQELQRVTAEMEVIKAEEKMKAVQRSDMEKAMDAMRKEVMLMRKDQNARAAATENAKLQEKLAAMEAEMAKVKETALSLQAAQGNAAALAGMSGAHQETADANAKVQAAHAATASAVAAATPDAATTKKKMKLVTKARWQMAATKSVADAAEAKKNRLLDEIARSPDELESIELQRKLRLERAKERRNRELERQAKINKEAALNNEAVFDEPGAFVLSKALRQWSGTVEPESRGSGA
jgi:hypothetical protein